MKIVDLLLHLVYGILYMLAALMCVLIGVVGGALIFYGRNFVEIALGFAMVASILIVDPFKWRRK